MLGRRLGTVSFLAIILLLLVGCASPVALHQAVLEYDRTINRVETELLLLNIADFG